MSDVQVTIRTRPLIEREKDGGGDLWSLDETHIHQKNSLKPYTFDRVFGPDTSTDEVYRCVAQPIVKSAMNGFHGTVFAYGQTASGKTFTMMGNEDHPGLIPRAIQEIFDTIENTPEREFLIRASYVEIYNENVMDLLGPKDSVKKNLDVREDKDGNVFVNNLTEKICNQPEALLSHLKMGESNRHFAATNMNERSSRSHCIFKVIIESKLRSVELDASAINVSHLNLVDLAGSEKAKHTGAVGQRLVEGASINKSLSTLGQVILQLSENAKFIQYRDSKLTRILQNSLGGNSKTAIIGNVTLASMEETLSTLRFATSAKCIKNQAVVNEVISDSALLKRYRQEILKLEEKLKITNEMMAAKEQEDHRSETDRMARLTQMICVSSQIQTLSVQQKIKRRQTWCPGKANVLPAIPPSSPVASSQHENDDSIFKLPAAPFSRPPLSTSFNKPCTPRRRTCDTESRITSRVTFSSPEDDTFFSQDLNNFEGNLNSPSISDLQFRSAELVFPSEHIACQTETVLVEASCQTEKDDDTEEIAQKEAIACQTEPEFPGERDLKSEVELLLSEMKILKCWERSYKDLQQEYNILKEEFQALEQFTRYETMHRDQSILEKEVAEDPKNSAEEERNEIARLKKDAADAEVLVLDLKKELSVMETEKKSCAESMAYLEAELKLLKLDKADFDIMLELEREKSAQRENELKEQLVQAYAQAELHSMDANHSNDLKDFIQTNSDDDDEAPIPSLGDELLQSNFNQIQRFEERNTELEKQIAELLLERTENQELLKRVEAQKDDLENQMREHVADSIDSQDKLMEAQERIYEMEQELMTLKNQMKEVAHMVELEAQTKALSQAHIQCQTKMLADDDPAHNEKSTDIGEMSREIEEVTKGLELKSAEIEERTKDLKMRTIDIEAKREEIEMRSADIEQWSSEIEMTSLGIEEKNREIEEKTQELKMRTTEIEAKKAEIEMKREDIKQRSEEIEMTSSEIEEKSREIEEKTQKLKLRTTEIEAKKAEIEIKSEDIKQRSEEIEMTSSEIEEKSREIEEKTQELKLRTTEIEAKKAEIEMRSTDIEQWSSEIDMKSSEIDELSAVNEERAKDMERLKERMELLVHSLDAERREKEEALSSLQMVEEEIALLKEEIELQKEERDLTVNEKDTEAKALMEESDRLTGLLTEKEIAYETLKSEVNELKEHLHDVASVGEGAAKETEKLKQELERRRQEIVNLKQCWESAQESSLQLQSKCEDLEETVKLTLAERAEAETGLSQQLREKTEEMSVMKQQLLQMEAASADALKECQKKIADLEAAKDRVKQVSLQGQSARDVQLSQEIETLVKKLKDAQREIETLRLKALERDDLQVELDEAKKNIMELTACFLENENSQNENEESAELQKLRDQIAEFTKERKQWLKQEEFLKKCCQEADEEAEQNLRENTDHYENELRKLKEKLHAEFSKEREEWLKQEEFLKKCCDEADEEAEQNLTIATDRHENELLKIAEKLQADFAREKAEWLKQEEFLKKCCEEADEEAEQNLRANTDRYENELRKLQEKLNAQKSLQQKSTESDELFQFKLKVSDLETKLITARAPLEKKIRSLEKEAKYYKEQNESLRTEVRRMHHTSPDDTILTVMSFQPKTTPTPHAAAAPQVCGQQIDRKIDTLKAEKECLVNKVKELSDQLGNKKREMLLKEVSQRETEKALQTELRKYRDLCKKKLSKTEERQVLAELGTQTAAKTKGHLGQYKDSASGLYEEEDAHQECNQQ